MWGRLGEACRTATSLAELTSTRSRSLFSIQWVTWERVTCRWPSLGFATSSSLGLFLKPYLQAGDRHTHQLHTGIWDCMEVYVGFKEVGGCCNTHTWSTVLGGDVSRQFFIIQRHETGGVSYRRWLGAWGACYPDMINCIGCWCVWTVLYHTETSDWCVTKDLYTGSGWVHVLLCRTLHWGQNYITNVFPG